MLPSLPDPGRRLSVGATPRPDESLPGFLVRVARRAGFGDVARFATLVGLRQPGAALTGPDFGPAATFLGLDPSRLDAIAYRPASRPSHHRFLGGVVNREHLVLAHRRACPRCLAEIPYHRAAWDLALVTACPEHATRLVERCAGCGARFGWKSADLALCRCGADLRRTQATVARPGEGQADRSLVELLDPANVDRLPQPLRDSDGADILFLVMNLGMFLTGWRKQRRVETLRASGADRVAEVVQAGLGALVDWPAPLQGFLANQARDASGRAGRYGARKSLGPFYSWLTALETGHVKSALAAAAADYVAGDPALSRRTHRSALLTGPAPRRALGLKEAAELLGSSGAGVRRRMAAGLVPSTASEGRGVPILIDRAAVEALAAVQADEANLKQACEMLAVSKARVLLLVGKGVLTPRRRTPGAEGGGTFRRADLEALLTELSAITDGNATGSRLVGFEHAAEALRRRGVDLPGMLTMVRERRLPVAAADAAAVGLKRLRFGARRVREVCRALEDSERPTVQVVAERTGLKWAVVANLIERGLLCAAGGCVDAADVKRFLADHVTGAALAVERGTSPRSLAARLALQGVAPVVGPGVDGSRQNIYRRADLSREVCSGLARQLP